MIEFGFDSMNGGSGHQTRAPIVVAFCAVQSNYLYTASDPHWDCSIRPRLCYDTCSCSMCPSPVFSAAPPLSVVHRSDDKSREFVLYT
jgi:hypothetical protein